MPSYEESKLLIDVSKVYGKGKTQIPSDIRKMFLITDGDKLKWFVQGGEIIVERAVQQKKR